MARILVAKSDAGLRRALCLALRRAGHDVETASDGAEALAALRDPAAGAAGGWDVLLADLGLPAGRQGVPDGPALASMAAARVPGLRVVSIAGFAAVALASPDAGPPGNRLLSKPIHLRELPRQIDRILAA